MKSTQYVLEVALFTVKTEQKANISAIREAVRQELQSFKGLISLECFTPMNDDLIFADIARWESIEDAQVAASAFEAGDFRFLPYIDAIEAVQFLGHFQPQLQTPALRDAI